MIEFHVAPRGGRWHITCDGNRVAVYNSRQEALQQTCELAAASQGPPADTHAQIVLHNVDGQQRRMTIPRSNRDTPVTTSPIRDQQFPRLWMKPDGNTGSGLPKFPYRGDPREPGYVEGV